MKSREKLVRRIIEEDEVNLRGTKINIVSPTSLMNLFNLIDKRERNLRQVFKEIEGRIKQRADPFYEDITGFKEVGGFCLIRRNESKYFWKTIFETEGEKARKVVSPGKGLDIQWSCVFPKIIDMNVVWDSVAYFIKYHSHPFLNIPNPEDISGALEDFFFIPKNVKYYQAIYSKIWTPNFLWLEHYKK